VPAPGFSAPAGPIQAGDPKAFVAKLDLLAADVYQAVATLIVPLSMIAMLFSCIALVLGGLLGWDAVRRFGWGGLFMCVAGLLLFYGIPVIIGLIRAVAARFA
jgi:hypothetical protein